MRKYLVLLLLLLSGPAWSSQIIVGLRSDNLVSWSVWERQGSRLKHYQVLYNKGPEPLDIEIRLRRFALEESSLTDLGARKTLYHLRVPSQQVTRLKYPKGLADHEYAEYFENGQGIGLLPASVRQPSGAALRNEYHFYTDQGLDGHQLGYWVAFKTLNTPPAQVALTAANAFYTPDALLKEEYHFVKLYPFAEITYPSLGTLDSLAATDAAIARFDQAHPSAVLAVGSGIAAPGFSLFAIYLERVEDGFIYDESKRRIPHKSYGHDVVFLPVFPSWPR
jgi:hypothetical protein